MKARLHRLLADVRLRLILRWLPRMGAGERQMAVVRSSLPLLEQDGLLELTRRLLGEPQPIPGTAPDMEAVINFSSYERDAWVSQRAGQIKAGAKVLDAGAGQCKYRPLFAHTEYKSQDFAQYAGSGQGPLQESWNYGKLDYVCDITKIPVPDGSFDVVLCTEVLEHVPDPLATMRELVRVLAPGGTLLMTVPLGSGIHQEPFHYYGGFSRYFFLHVFSELGMESVEIKPLGGLLKHVAQELARAGRVLAGSGELNPQMAHIVNEWLPHRLWSLDDQYFIEQFTVGYLVEAKKNQ